MKFGYLSGWTLPMAISKASNILLSKTWLIVALDSNRGKNLHKSYDYLKNKLPANSKWTGAGIRLEGHDVSALIKKSGIIVPFSAAYVVDNNFVEIPFLYNLTSESGTFESNLPISLKESFLKPGILAYFADGSGLNYCLADENDFIEGDSPQNGDRANK